MTVDLTQFDGMYPRLPAERLSANAASYALDCDFRHGDLRPFRAALKLRDGVEGKRVHIKDGIWFTLDNCVRAPVRGSNPSCKRLAWIDGDGRIVRTKAEVARDEQADGQPWEYLGIENPDNAPIVSGGGNAGGQATSYVITYVSAAGEESAPSPPSAVIDRAEGQSISLSFLGEAPANALYLRVYRTESAYAATGGYSLAERKGREETFYFEIAELPANSTSFIDNVAAEDISLPLDSEGNAPPPKKAACLDFVPNGATLACIDIENNAVCFSRQGEYWNWRNSGRYILDDIAYALVCYSDYTHVVSNGSPYAIRSEIFDEDAEPRAVIRHADYLPLVSSPDGVCRTPIGTVYVCGEGIALLSGMAAPQIISRKYFSASDWRGLKPETMRLGFSHGVLYICSDTHNFAVSLTAEAEFMGLTASSIKARYFCGNDMGELIYCDENGNIMQHEAGAGYIPFVWRSREFEPAHRESVCALRVMRREYGVLSAKYYANGRLCDTMELGAQGRARLPRVGTLGHYSFEISGTAPVRRLTAGGSFWELA